MEGYHFWEQPHGDNSSLHICDTLLAQAKVELLDTEKELGTLKTNAGQHRATNCEQVEKLQQKLSCYKSIMHAVEAYDEQCGLLKDEVAALVTTETQRRMDTHGISGRVKQEVSVPSFVPARVAGNQSRCVIVRTYLLTRLRALRPSSRR